MKDPKEFGVVRMGGTIDNTVFAGEVKPRHEGDLGFRIGGKVIARDGVALAEAP